MPSRIEKLTSSRIVLSPNSKVTLSNRIIVSVEAIIEEKLGIFLKVEGLYGFFRKSKKESRKDVLQYAFLLQSILEIVEDIGLHDEELISLL